MNKELIQKLFSKSCWDEQAEVDIEDFISVEKFAQLIVRECCDQFDKHPYVGTKRTQYIYGYIQGRVDAEQQIKQHFGVEE